MGHVVVELEMVVDDCMAGMVELNQMLECAGSFLVLSFDIVNLDWFDFYRRSGVASKETGQAKRVSERRER